MSELQTNREFRYNAHTIRYGVQGSGPPLVAVHGTPWSSYNLRHLVNGLSDTHTVYFYDLLGYGSSDKPDDDVSLGVQNSILAAIIDHWGLDKPVGLGHDYGGATLLRAAVLNKIPFERLVLIDPVAVSPWGSEFLRHVRSHLEAFSGMPEYMHRALIEAYVRTAMFQELPQEVIERTLRPWTDAGGQAAFYRQIAQADDRYTREVEPHYSRLQQPTLILWGAEDSWIPADRGHRLASMLPDASLHVIDSAGHLVIEEKPKRLLEEISGFFGDQRGVIG